jgi:hypothetical protein
VPPAGSRAAGLVPQVAATLGVNATIAEEIVVAFERHVAEPLEQNLARHNAHTLAKRNPMIYTARGATTVDQWVDRRLEDWETSAIEGHLGTW